MKRKPFRFLTGSGLPRPTGIRTTSTGCRARRASSYTPEPANTHSRPVAPFVISVLILLTLALAVPAAWLAIKLGETICRLQEMIKAMLT